MKHMYLKIKPVDTLMFNKGTSFMMDDNAWITSMQHPHPSMIYGALFSALYRKRSNIRTKLINLNKQLKKKEIGNQRYDEEIEDILSSHLIIKQIYLADRQLYDEVIYMRVPQDIYCHGADDVRYGEFHDYEGNKIIFPPEGDLKPVTGYDYYMNLSDYRWTYTTQQPIASLTPWDELWNYSPKMGIKIDSKTRQAEEGKLFRVDMIEPNCENLGYIVEIECKENCEAILQKGVLKLGGEGKLCHYDKIDQVPRQILKYNNYERATSSKNIKMITTTPMVISNDNLCDFKPTLDELPIRGVVMDKPFILGGFDMNKQMHKKMYKGIPAGTVYLIKGKQEKSLAETRQLIDEQLQKQIVEGYKGFGQYVLAPYKGEL